MSPDDYTPEPPDPLDVFLHRPSSELLAFIYKRKKADGLRELLTIVLNQTPPGFSRQDLQEEIADLRNNKLPQVAAVVEEYVDLFPTELDERFYDWGSEPTPSMIEHWRGYRRRIIERRRNRRGLVSI